MSLSYTVSITEPAAHLIDVTLDIADPVVEGQILRLPNWIPGSYMIRDFSRNIVTIEATSHNEAVSLTKLDKSTWVSPAGLEQLTVRYRVYAWDLSVRAAHVDQQHAFFNGTSIFLSVETHSAQSHKVTFIRPKHDVERNFQLATTLSAFHIDDDGYGQYIAKNYDELIDHPVEQGAFKRLVFTACGISHEIILTGACHFDEERLTADLTRICEYQIRFFGEPAPVERYLFLVMVVDAGYGGLEHRASTALMITRENLPVVGEESVSDKYLDFLGLCSHEYFHTWNVKRIKPARFVPYELNAESYTELLWFFEGMTSYYDDLVLVRAGIIDTERYLGLLSKTLTRVQRGAGRHVQSVTDSSFDAWNKFYKQDENAPNSIVSYYAKGALIALCLDSLMRSDSHQQISLDSLMRKLWHRWQSDYAGVAEQEPQELASLIIGKDLSDFFDTALYTTNDLPLVESLNNLGVDLSWCARISHADVGGTRSQSSLGGRRQPWFGATISDVAGGVKIHQVMRHGPAQRAGLSAGDLIIALNSLSVTKADVENHLVRYADLDCLTVHYFRLGQLFTASLPIEMAPDDTAVLETTDQDKLNAWLHDPRLAHTANDTQVVDG